jgi:mxaJ protein
VPLSVTPIEPGALDAGLPFSFDIAMGVRRKETEFRDRIEGAMSRIRPQIDAILAAYRVPRADAARQPPS